jgi:hypothetical protein
MQYVLRVIHTLPTRRFIAPRALSILTHRPVIPYRVPLRLLCTMADHEPKPRAAEPNGPTVHEKAKKVKKDKKSEGGSSLEVCSSKG